MTDAAKRLYEEALKLDEEERSLLALRMLDSVGEAPEVIEKAWREEVTARLAALDDGSVEPIAWEDAKARIFARER